MNTVTRAQLAEVIYAQVGLSRNESADLLEHVLARVAAALEAGESVKISGFGTFSVRQKGRRIGRNPKTGKEVPILPRRRCPGLGSGCRSRRRIFLRSWCGVSGWLWQSKRPPTGWTALDALGGRRV